MPLPASGKITLYDIAAEFGGAVPHRLQEYYGSGGAPASGLISIQDFYGLSALEDIGLDGAANELTSAIAVSKGWTDSGATAINWLTTYCRFTYTYNVEGKIGTRGYSTIGNTLATQVGHTYTIRAYRSGGDTGLRLTPLIARAIRDGGSFYGSSSTTANGAWASYTFVADTTSTLVQVLNGDAADYTYTNSKCNCTAIEFFEVV